MNPIWPRGTKKAKAVKDVAGKSSGKAKRAPWVHAIGAMKTGGKSVSNRARCGLSLRKHRFMSLLRGNMGVRSAAQTSNAAAQNDTAPAIGIDAQLRETLASPIAANDYGAADHAAAKYAAADSSKPSTTMTFTYPPGSKPLLNYTIRRGIGVGGFGEVYFALSEAGKEVALKRIQRNLEIELRGVSHCLNLKHPNLVSLYDICRDDTDQSWVVMEFVNGPNLRSVLDQSPDGLNESEVRRWFEAIAAGVNHLHSAGLVHRDIKPGNVFDDMGIVKVGDYGLSKFISASHRGGHTESVGTFHYMAPEIGRGEYGRGIDVYAMGIVLHELLTGQVPFDGESCHEIIVKHLTAIPSLNDIPQPYRDVIWQALQKDPTKRQASVTEMITQLGWSQQSTLANTPIPVAEFADTPEPIVNAIPLTEPTQLTEPVARFSSYDQDASSNPTSGSNSSSSSDPIAAMAVASSTTDEPFARAVRASIADLRKWWGTLDRSPGAKKLLIVACGFFLFLNAYMLLPMLSLVGIVYVPYYIIRQMVLHTTQQPTYAEAQRIATSVGAPAKPKTKLQWRSHVRNDLRAKRSIHRAAELSTSWIAATFTVIALAIIAGVIGLGKGDVSATSIAPFGWMAAIVLLGSICILGMGKLWERDEGEALPRRLVMAGIGAGVGVAAYVVADYLKLSMHPELGRYNDVSELPQALYHASGELRPAAVMAHFALLFAAIRWWKPVDPLRRTRLSLWSVLVTLVGAWAIHQILPIPQPCGMMMAGGIAIAVQMSAPWIDPNKTQDESPAGLPNASGSTGETLA